jgi:predicted NACHT family NTPase
LFGITEKDLDHWHYDMMAQTMLIRNANGDYTPAHRSLLEFFVAYKFAAELGVLASDFTELAQAQSFLDSSAAPVDYAWSEYFSRQLNDSGVSMTIPLLRGFMSESLEKLRETFGKVTLTKTVLDLLVPMVDVENIERIIKVIERTRGKSEDEVGYVGGNAATLGVKVDSTMLEGRNLSGAVIKGADFSNASLRDANFTFTKLDKSVFGRNLGGIASIVFSPDEQFLVAGNRNGSIQLWAAADGREILTFQGHASSVISLFISSNSKILVTGSRDKSVKLWDAHTLILASTFKRYLDILILYAQLLLTLTVK